jgi:hypothetical protein
MTREDFTDEAFEQFVEERKTELFEYYGLDYFTETAYYETALKEFIKWADITILGEE